MEKIEPAEHFSGVHCKVLIKTALTLLSSGIDARDTNVLEVDEQEVIAMMEGIDHSRNGLVWHGHAHNLTMLLLAWRFMALNNTNKRTFMRCSVIPVRCFLPFFALCLTDWESGITVSSSYGKRIV